MKLLIENLGVLSRGEFDLDKDLIVFAGKNNTGKSYVNAIIHALTPGTYSPIIFELSNQALKSLAHELLINRSISIPLDNFLNNNLNDFYRQISNQIKENIHYLLGYETKENLTFLDLNKINLDLYSSNLKSNEKHISDYFELDIKNNTWQNRIGRIRANKEANSFQVNIELLINNDIKNEIESIKLLENLLSDFFLSILQTFNHFEVAERATLVPYHIKLLARMVNGKTNELNIPSSVYNYAMYLVSSKEFSNFKSSNYYDLGLQFENELLQGQTNTDEFGAIYFSPNNKNVSVPIKSTATSIKSLTGLILYLKHLARPNEIIMIDEPEQNLHPDNQVILTRLLVEMVNRGLRLIISTHSSHILRELNNMIMLGSVPEEKFAERDDLIKELNENQLEMPLRIENTLHFSKVGAYLFDFTGENGTSEAKSLPINETGFGIETIDKTIRQLNNEARDIYYRLYA